MLDKILRLTLKQLLWIVTALVFVILLAIWRHDNDDVSVESEESLLRHFDDGEAKIHPRNPSIVWWSEGMRPESSTKICIDIKCDIFSFENRHRPTSVAAYLFYASTIKFNTLPLPRRPGQIIWGLLHDESPRNVQELMHEETLYLFNFSSTFSRYSDVPFPLQYVGSLESLTSKDYFVHTSVKNLLLNEISPVLYLQTDCETSTERDAYVETLMKFIQIDSYGACLKNKELPRELTEDYLNKLYTDEVLQFVARYKFVITIENGVCEDYITEKFWRAIKVGTVPIYFGSPSIKDWLPNNKSAIILDDFPTPKLLSEHITELLRDDKLYEQYLEHKTERKITNKRLINELEERPYQTDHVEILNSFECFVCRKVHAMKHKFEVNVVNKSHYNCPKPISALTLGVNPLNSWVSSWELSKDVVKSIYKKAMGI